MTRDLVSLIKGIAPVIREFVHASLEPFRQRLTLVEMRVDAVRDGKDGAPGAKGDPGVPGDPGLRGADGAAGRDGVNGKDGLPGTPGPQGQPGEKGARGEAGPPGPSGERGHDGVAGIPGPPGPQGERGHDGGEGRPGAPGPQGEPGRDGRDVDPAVLAGFQAELVALKAQVERQVKSVEMPDVTALVRAAVDAAIAAIPQPKDGAPGRDGKDGVSVSLVELTAAVDLAVRQALERLPVPKDGRDGLDGQPGAPGPAGKDGSSVSLEQVASLVQSVLPTEVERAVSRVPVPKDGAAGRDGTSITSMLIDQRGHLVVTLSDGQVRDVGEIRGPAGAAGVDGFGFDDLSVDPVATDRVMTLRFQRGERVKTFGVTLQGFMLHKGVYEPGRTYEPGDCVTKDGGTWHATASTAERPGAGATAWRLIVKRGDPGRPGQPGADGAPGRDGRDLTQVTFEGGKY